MAAIVSPPWEDRSCRWPESWLWWWRRWQPSCGFWSVTSLGGAEKHRRISPRRWSWSNTPSRGDSPCTNPQRCYAPATSTTSGGPAWRTGPGSGSRPYCRRWQTSHRLGTDRTGRGSSCLSNLHGREWRKSMMMTTEQIFSSETKKRRRLCSYYCSDTRNTALLFSIQFSSIQKLYCPFKSNIKTGKSFGTLCSVQQKL